MNKKIIIYIIVIIIILATAFFSQQVASKDSGKNFISTATNYLGASLSKGTTLGIQKTYSKIEENIQDRAGELKNGIIDGYQKIAETKENLVNYFSGIANSIEGKTNNNCTAPVNK